MVIRGELKMNGFRIISGLVCILLCLAGSLGLVLIIKARVLTSKKGNKAGLKKLLWEKLVMISEWLCMRISLRFLDAGRIRREISEGLMLIRNRIAVSDRSRITTDIMLEELIEDADRLRYPYSRMLSLVRTGEKKKAVSEFEMLTGSSYAKEYARMILMLDEMDPIDVNENLSSFQRGMNEERITQIRKRDAGLSDLLYLPVVLNLLLIFFNFLYVGYFMQQKDLMAFLS